MPISAERQADCHHRWTRNGACAKPGCRAIRERGAPLARYERLAYSTPKES